MTSASISKLLGVLAAEERVHRELRELLVEERGVMLALDADALYGLASRKELLAEEARMAEEARVALVETLAGELGIAVRPVTLGRLCDALGEPDAEPLREAQSRLLAVVSSVRELADANRALGGERLDQVGTTLRLLGRLSPSTPAARPGAPGGLVRTSA